MKCSVRFRNAALGICLAALSGIAAAGDMAYDLALKPAVGQSTDMQSYMLALNDVPASNAALNVASATPAKPAEFSEPLFSLNKAHEYLGIATILAAAATVMTASEGCEGAACTNYVPNTNGTHAKMGRLTRTLALSAVVTGVAAHWDDMHPFEDGLSDPDTQHWLIAGVGALLLANAVSKAPGNGHAGQAELGAAMMVVGIKLAW
jgi:hypothetical protein